jgi:hypothetical protein
MFYIRWRNCPDRSSDPGWLSDRIRAACPDWEDES